MLDPPDAFLTSVRSRRISHVLPQLERLEWWRFGPAHHAYRVASLSCMHRKKENNINHSCLISYLFFQTDQFDERSVVKVIALSQARRLPGRLGGLLVGLGILDDRDRGSVGERGGRADDLPVFVEVDDEGRCCEVVDKGAQRGPKDGIHDVGGGQTHAAVFAGNDLTAFNAAARSAPFVSV
jgi:hypothetical protein